jgi:hypothetical protein
MRAQSFRALLKASRLWFPNIYAMANEPNYSVYQIRHDHCSYHQSQHLLQQFLPFSRILVQRSWRTDLPHYVALADRHCGSRLE